MDFLVRRMWALEGCLGLVLYQNGDLCSSNLNDRSVVGFGPDERFTGRDLGVVLAAFPRLGDVPSRFKYPVAYCHKETVDVNQLAGC